MDPDQPAWPATPPVFEGPPDPGPPVSATPVALKPKRRVLLPVVTVVLAVATVVFAGLWLQAKGEADDLQAKIDRRAQVAAAARNARPDLYETANAVQADDGGIEYTGDADSLDIEIYYPDDVAMGWLDAFLGELGFPGATTRRMEQTRALDGTLEAEGDHASATWTYHPDDGLSVVVSVDG